MARFKDKSQSINHRPIDAANRAERVAARQRFIQDALRSSGTGALDDEGNPIASENYAGLEASDAAKDAVQNSGGGPKTG